MGFFIFHFSFKVMAAVNLNLATAIVFNYCTSITVDPIKTVLSYHEKLWEILRNYGQGTFCDKSND